MHVASLAKPGGGRLLAEHALERGCFRLVPSRLSVCY